jgi:V8-like Glu-specific endopeptidase
VADIQPADVFRLINALQAQSVATLAAAIVAASGRPWSIDQVRQLANDIHFANYPAPQLGAYKEWEKTKAARLAKVHGTKP